jgi:hypothetical protein
MDGSFGGLDPERAFGDLTTEVFLSRDPARVNAKHLVTHRVHLWITLTPHARHTDVTQGCRDPSGGHCSPSRDPGLSESPEGTPKPAVGWGWVHPPIKDASRACVVCRRAEPAFAIFSRPTCRPHGARQCVFVTRSEANGISENDNQHRTVQARRPVSGRNSS